MSNVDVLKSLKKGDIVKVTRTLKVDDKWCGETWANDVADDKLSYLLTDSPSLKIEMVKKVAKQRTDYKVGDVVSGDELRATQWKRGTIVKVNVPSGSGTEYILQANGLWARPDHLLDRSKFLVEYEFSDFSAYAGYVIKYLPD